MPDFEKRLALAVDLKRNKRSKEALKMLEDLHRECPGSISVKGYLAGTHLNLGRYDVGIRIFREIVRENPLLKYGGSVNLFHALLDSKRILEAFEELDRFQRVAFSQDYENIRSEILGTYGSTESYNSEDGIEYYEELLSRSTRAIESNPDYFLNYRNRGNTYYNLKRFDMALADYSIALDLCPDDAQTYNNRGNTYYQIKQFAKAKQDYLKAMDLGYECREETYFALGTAYDFFGEYEDALRSFSAAIELDQSYVDAYVSRGLTSFHLKRYSDALDDFTNALELNPDYLEALHNRALTYRALGDKGKAIQDEKRLAARGKSLVWACQEY